MPRGYRFVDHTADVEYMANGPTMEKAVGNAFLGLFATLSDISRVSKLKSPTRSIRIKDSAGTMEDLLWYSLQDALSIADSEGVFPYELAGLKITESRGKFSLSATLVCKTQEQAYGNFDVKGISRYDLSAKKGTKGYSISVVVDV
ncbi:MAG: archease [Candidatus Micrarchaeota archaeon]|nr:archease [Candidatus Micrarchaeota archaeon]